MIVLKRVLPVLVMAVMMLQAASALANDGNEPPKNPWLADSPWPMSHRNPYCQASSPLPGLEPPVLFAQSDFTFGMPGLITIATSQPYPGGKHVLWGSSSTSVFKADPDTRRITYISTVAKDGLSVDSIFSSGDMLSGAYTLVDRDNIFYVPRFTRLYAFGDAVQDDPFSEVVVKGVFTIPEARLSDPEEKIVGLTMTYDGMLAFVTSHGLVGVVSRTFDKAEYLSLSGEAISNSLACDEDGGIYVVGSRKAYRVQWTGSLLSTDDAQGGWVADYEIGEDVSGVRLGVGSGSTPTLMGTGSQDKFVVITDGQKLMNLVLLWRGAIPSDWEQIPGTKDRRIAAQVPVTFGNPDAVDSLSEQSVCVRGYGALVVNNQLKTSLSNDVLNVLISGITPIAPYGAEKLEWNPATRTLQTAWVNKTVSMPNGIPCMSSATNLIYDVGQGRFGRWTFEALDWDTGKSVFSFRYGTSLIFNSAYAATEIGLNSSLYSGTVFGMVRMEP